MSELPKDLDKFIKSRLASLGGVMAQAQLPLPDDKVFQQQLNTALLASNFVFDQIHADPRMLSRLYQSGDLVQSYEQQEFATRLHKKLEHCDSVQDLMSRLRTFRHYEMLRIIWRDVNSLAELNETMQDLSFLAFACIRYAAQLLQSWQEGELGEPCDAKGVSQKLQIIAMGKLGACELNLSSDVDLIFAYPEEGELKGKTHLSNQQFFIRLAQKLVKVLHEVTAEGFVFRVDTRLRPYGESGALALSFSALSEYYQNEARDWERYAMVKARVIYGDDQENRRLHIMLRQFTYRIYLDFSAMQALRDLKQQIRKQVRVKGMENNIKLGEGGIREVEFIAQVFQLIHGGHDYALQTPRIFPALEILGRREYIYHVPKIIAAYTFFRNLEHRLQAMDNQQTHSLPTEPELQVRIACTLGFSSWPDLLKKLDEYRHFVNSQFELVFEKPSKKQLPAAKRDEDQLDKIKRVKIQAIIDEWSQRFAERELSGLADQRLKQFLPHLQRSVLWCQDPQETLTRVFRVVEHLLHHSAYLVLFEENPQALSVLVQLCDASSWITNQIARYPTLLAELLNEKRLYLFADFSQLSALLDEQFAHVDYSDGEQVLDALRRFKRRQMLHVAAADVMGKLSVMKVSDSLTDIASAILQRALKVAWDRMITKYGRPRRENGSLCDLDFIMIAYGKLGGIELGYGSDLDLVFVHDADEQAMTEPLHSYHQTVNSITGAQFYARLAKHLLHTLSAQMTSGSLYSVDTRLKPGGASGLLVSSFAAFAEYQSNSAWLWEHQALVRARVVAGDEYLAEKFSTLRQAVLSRVHEPKKLRKRIIEMRKRMRDEAKSIPKDKFSLKQSRGGMTDIEFLAQYVVLAWAKDVPELLIFTDNIRIFETCESAGLMDQATVNFLCDTYREYRRCRHRLSLQRLPDEVPRSEFVVERKRVEKIWRKLLK